MLLEKMWKCIWSASNLKQSWRRNERWSEGCCSTRKQIFVLKYRALKCDMTGKEVYWMGESERKRISLECSLSWQTWKRRNDDQNVVIRRNKEIPLKYPAVKCDVGDWRTWTYRIWRVGKRARREGEWTMIRRLLFSGNKHTHISEIVSVNGLKLYVANETKYYLQCGKILFTISCKRKTCLLNTEICR